MGEGGREIANLPVAPDAQTQTQPEWNGSGSGRRSRPPPRPVGGPCSGIASHCLVRNVQGLMMCKHGFFLVLKNNQNGVEQTKQKQTLHKGGVKTRCENRFSDRKV